MGGSKNSNKDAEKARTDLQWTPPSYLELVQEMLESRSGSSHNYKARSLLTPQDSLLEKMNDENKYENVIQRALGPYRGDKTSLFNGDARVIFDQESTPPNKYINLLAGSLTPDKGWWGTVNTQSHHAGKNRLIVFGDPETGEPSSWTVLRWQGTGKKHPETEAEYHEWKQVPNAAAAVKNHGFEECFTNFQKASSKSTKK